MVIRSSKDVGRKFWNRAPFDLFLFFFFFTVEKLSSLFLYCKGQYKFRCRRVLCTGFCSVLVLEITADAKCNSTSPSNSRSKRLNLVWTFPINQWPLVLSFQMSFLVKSALIASRRFTARFFFFFIIYLTLRGVINRSVGLWLIIVVERPNKHYEFIVFRFKNKLAVVKWVISNHRKFHGWLLFRWKGVARNREAWKFRLNSLLFLSNIFLEILTALPGSLPCSAVLLLTCRESFR